MIHICGSSEVMHLAHVCILSGIDYNFRCSILQVIVSSALVHSCGNSEVTTFIMCAHYYQVYFQIPDTYDCRIDTLVQSCRHGGEV